MSWWQALLLPEKSGSPFPTSPPPSPPSSDRHKGRHDHCITDVGSLGTGGTSARAWPLSDEHWLSSAEHTGPWRGKTTWGKTRFAQDFNVSSFVPGSLPKMEMGIGQVEPRNPFSCKDPLLSQVTGLLRVIKVICISGLDLTSRGLQLSLLPAAVSR